MKNAHLLCCAANRTAQRISIYASRFDFLRALHLNIFEQPPSRAVFNSPTETTYRDSLVVITGDSILFKRYNIFERDRLVLFSDIEKIIVKPASIWNGKFRFHGTGDFHTWFPRDFQRYKRDKIFFTFIRNKWWRIGFTVEDSAAVIKIFQEKGLIRDIV